MPKELKISNFGGKIEGGPDTGVKLGGPVKIEGDNGLEAFSKTALLDLKAKTVTLEGDVSVYQGNQLHRGQRAVYFYEMKYLDTTGLRASLDPILLESGKFTAEKRGDKQFYVGYDAGITTHDAEDPNYWIRAKKTRVYPGEKIVFNNMLLYAGDTPVFWLPYLSQPLDRELGYHFLPGARSNWGPFLLNTYGIMLGGDKDPDTGENQDAWLLSRWHLDFRAQRGVGAGVDLTDTRLPDPETMDGLSMYYLNDLKPQKSRDGLPREPVDEDRFRVDFNYRYTFDPPDDADWRLDANLTWLSDRYYLQDYELERYRTDPAPDNTLGIFRRTDDSLLSILARFRLNDFYRADTRLPEVTFDQPRRALLDLAGLPLQHEGTTSLGFITEQAADGTRTAVIDPMMNLTLEDDDAQSLLDQLSGYERQLAERMLALPVGDPQREAIRTQLLDASYTRFRTYQEFSMPTMLGDFLSVVPQAGLGYTAYGAVQGPVESLDRTYLHAGVETSVKFSRGLDGFHNHALGLDGMTHVFQPYGIWSVVSTDDFDYGDPGVDRLTPSTRPRPLDPTRFTAVDELSSWNVVRLGTRNRLLTKRDSGSHEWLFLDTYLDAFLNDPEGERNISNLYNDARWQPVPWLSASVETQFPIINSGSGFTELSSSLTFIPTRNFEFTIGYNWLDGHPYLVDSSQLYLRTYTRLSENWGIGTNHWVQFDDGILEYQQYSLHRDLNNWVAALGVTLRDNRYQDEYGLVFSLTLKEFPAATLPFTLNAQ